MNRKELHDISRKLKILNYDIKLNNEFCYQIGNDLLFINIILEMVRVMYNKHDIIYPDFRE